MEKKHFSERGNPGVSGRFLDVQVLTGIKDGKNIYGPRPHVEIIIAGKDTDVFCGPVTEIHKNRFPEAWAAYEAAKAAPVIAPPSEVVADAPKKKRGKPSEAVADDAA